MPTLQFKNQDIHNKEYQFYTFDKGKKDYSYTEILKTVALALPQLKSEIDSFLLDFLGIAKNDFDLKTTYNYKNIKLSVPYATDLNSKYIEPLKITNTIEDFLIFSDKIKNLNERYEFIKNELLKHYDKKQLSDTYQRHVKSTIYSTNINSTNKQNIKEVELFNYENGRTVLKKISIEKFLSIKKDPSSMSLNHEELFQFNLMNIVDLADLLKRKNPFTKLLEQEIYNAKIEDFNYKEQQIMTLPNIDIYFLMVEFENTSDPLRWVNATGSKGGTQIKFVIDIKDATPMNEERALEVMEYYNHLSCCKYSSTVVGPALVETDLSQKITAKIEKDKLTENLEIINSENKELPIQKRITKI